MLIAYSLLGYGKPLGIIEIVCYARGSQISTLISTKRIVRYEKMAADTVLVEEDDISGLIAVEAVTEIALEAANKEV